MKKGGKLLLAINFIAVTITLVISYVCKENSLVQYVCLAVYALIIFTSMSNMSRGKELH